MTDGFRWQEVFRGADPALLTKENGVTDIPGTKQLFVRDTPQQSRAALLPFLWGTMAKQGQIFGNRDAGSDAYVTNGFNFSYPGYNETLSGYPDPRISSNDNVPNPNVTVLEWLHDQPGFKGRVAAFGAWNVIANAANGTRGGFPANSAYEPFRMSPMTPRMESINLLKAETKVWPDESFDSFPFFTALEYLKVKKPRVLFLSLGETDEWAHDGKYELYLKSARRIDDYLRLLWETVQSMPEYRGKTTLVFSPDHGRGEAPVQWKSHGEKVPDSKYIWMAFLGPDTPALGERKNVPEVTQSRIAATVAALMGRDYAGAVAKAGKPIADVLSK
jgi:hypothetical protein